MLPEPGLPWLPLSSQARLTRLLPTSLLSYRTILPYRSRTVSVRQVILRNEEVTLAFSQENPEGKGSLTITTT